MLCGCYSNIVVLFQFLIFIYFKAHTTVSGPIESDLHANDRLKTSVCEMKKLNYN